MIIEALLSALYRLLHLILSPINIPQAPPEMAAAFENFNDILQSANSLLALVIPVNIMPFLTISLVLFGVEHGYKPLMWIFNKILEVIP